MLRFGVMLRPGHFPFSHMLTCMRVAEDAGFEFMWFGDSHLIWQEVSPYLAAAASGSRRLTVGPLVSNPVTRHPTVMASMIATIAQLYEVDIAENVTKDTLPALKRNAELTVYEKAGTT